jgi:hypothetical protein
VNTSVLRLAVPKLSVEAQLPAAGVVAVLALLPILRRADVVFAGRPEIIVLTLIAEAVLCLAMLSARVQFRKLRAERQTASAVAAAIRKQLFEA